MQFARAPAALLLPLLFLAAAGAQKHFLTANEFAFDSIIGKPPVDDSPEHRQEVDQMLALQAARTPADEKRCKAEEKVNPFVFAEVLGSSFNKKDLPITAKLFAEITSEATAIADVPKKKWARLRPPVADPRIHPCVSLEKSGSFPSGHATRGIVWATLLSEIFPDKRDAIMARGKLIGDDRVLGGIHYPTDVVAGDRLGAAIAKKLLANGEFESEFRNATEECHAAMFAHPK